MLEVDGIFPSSVNGLWVQGGIAGSGFGSNGIDATPGCGPGELSLSFRLRPTYYAVAPFD
jgi:hypothetical protein